MTLFSNSAELSADNNNLSFKRKLSLVFDDGLETRVWYNLVDYVIILIIIVSTTEILLSTYPAIVKQYGNSLSLINTSTTILFSIEIFLRIWTCGLVNPRYLGWRGKLKYCFSFYGIIDLLSVVPAYLYILFPFHAGIVKVLKVFRIFRVMKYGSSFNHLKKAIRSKRAELLISAQLLIAVTFILSIILFFVENRAQPKVFVDIVKTLLWSFSKYINDPAGLAGFVPITFIGKSIASLIGVLGIAIFAVPAGLIGSGFLEVINNEKKKEEINSNIQNIISSFKNLPCRITNLFFPPIYQRIETIKAKLDITDDDILKAIRFSPNLRTRNLASAESPNREKSDVIVIEYFPVNTSYGYFIDRKSNITIVNPVGRSEAGISFFAYHTANLGGFNYISNEFYSLNELKSEYIYGFYNIEPDLPPCEDFEKYKNDILSVAKTEKDWIIFLLSSAGYVGKEVFDADFHFAFGGEKGEENLDFENCTINDVDTFKNFYIGFKQTLKETFNKNTATHKYYGNVNPKTFSLKLHKMTEANVLSVRISWEVTCWSENITNGIIKLLAEELNKYLESDKSKVLQMNDYSKRLF